MSRTHAVAGVAAAALSVTGTGAYAAASQQAPAPHPEADTQQGTPAQPVNAEALSLEAYAAHAYVQVPQSYRAPQHHGSPTTYRVRPGDYLARIAAQFCGDPSRYPNLASANNLADPNVIYPEEILKLACHAALKAVLTGQVSAPSQQPSQPASQDEQDSSQQPASQPQSQDSQSQQSQPATQPQATVTGLSGTLSYSGLEQLWVAAGGPAWAEAQAATVAECESSGNQYAQNPSGASGYWQILGQVVAGNIFDPMVNAENAVSKFHASGDTWSQWVCRP